MPIYRSATDRTVSVGRYQFTQDTGVDLAELTEEVLELLASGAITEDKGVVEVVEVPESPKEPPAPITSPNDE